MTFSYFILNIFLYYRYGKDVEKMSKSEVLAQVSTAQNPMGSRQARLESFSAARNSAAYAAKLRAALIGKDFSRLGMSPASSVEVHRKARPG